MKIDIVATASRRNALRLAFGGAAAIAVSEPIKALPQDPDKQLRWLGEALEVSFSEFEISVGAYYQLAMSEPYSFAFKRMAEGGVKSPILEAGAALLSASRGRWEVASSLARDIVAMPVCTLAGLGIKSRAVEVFCCGKNMAHCSAAGIKYVLECEEMGMWRVPRMIELMRDLTKVAAHA